VSTSKRTDPGSVAFVGAGPGDPGLLTVRGVEMLREADVVVVDATDQEVLLDHAEGSAKSVPALAEDGSPLTAAARGRLVVSSAKGGHRVVRLLEGDPFTHATGADEALACAKAGVPFEIVPGVSTVTSVPAHAGIPLTVGRRRSVQVLDASAKVDTKSAAADTLVVVRAQGRLAEVATQLAAAERFDADTTVAAIAKGSTVEQATLVSTLGTLADDVLDSGLDDVTTLVVGDVVDHRDTLSWFESKPLFGWRVLVPRTKDQAGDLSRALRRAGAVPEEVPTISVEPPRNPQQVDKAVRGMVEGRYEWIAFTSVNALRAIKEKLTEYGLDARALSGLKVAAVGDKTAEALRSWGVEPDLVPEGEQSALGLLHEWPPYDEVLDPINRVFLPRADIATETLAAGLVELGWEVDDVTAYRTVRAAPPPAETRDAIKTGRFDAVVFTSSSTVRNLVGIAGKPHASTVIACIGPATVKTAEEHGLRVDVLAPEPSVEVLADSLAEFGSSRRTAMLEAGDPVTRPSQRRRGSARRKAT